MLPGPIICPFWLEDRCPATVQGRLSGLRRYRAQWLYKVGGYQLKTGFPGQTNE